MKQQESARPPSTVAAGDEGRRQRQAAPAVLLVRPRHFGYNPETAASNCFQPRALQPQPADAIQRSARAEHDALAAALRAAGVAVCVAEDTDEPPKPDAVFPNNWVSFEDDGTVILYPMEATSRRPERRPEIVQQVVDDGFRVGRVLDLSPLEAQGQFLEGTGSLVIDHLRGVAFAALSSRTHPAALAAFGRARGIETVAFRTADEQGTALYHTNVMLAIGSRYAVVCDAAIPDRDERSSLLARLAGTGREIVTIDFAQMRAFAANILELAGATGPVIAMSRTAHDALTPAQLAVLARCGAIVAADVSTIERTGGGSVRCMLAEIFLPRTG